MGTLSVFCIRVSEYHGIQYYAAFFTLDNSAKCWQLRYLFIYIFLLHRVGFLSSLSSMICDVHVFIFLLWLEDSVFVCLFIYLSALWSDNRLVGQAEENHYPYTDAVFVGVYMFDPLSEKRFFFSPNDAQVSCFCEGNCHEFKLFLHFTKILHPLFLLVFLFLTYQFLLLAFFFLPISPQLSFPFLLPL